MSRERDLQRVLDGVVVAVVRSPSSDQLVEVATALADGGVTTVEITMTVPGVLEVIRDVRKRLGDRLFLGAGTVLDTESARAAILAGAEYIVTPTLNPEVIRLCRRYDKLVMPGAFTPTEILTAWEAGACALGVGGALVEKDALARGDMQRVRSLAGEYMNIVRQHQAKAG